MLMASLNAQAEKLFRKKHGGGNPGTALKRSIANNLPNQVEFDALTSAYRLPTPSETEAINALRTRLPPTAHSLHMSLLAHACSSTSECHW